jgi:hypothetical protein
LFKTDLQAVPVSGFIPIHDATVDTLGEIVKKTHCKTNSKRHLSTFPFTKDPSTKWPLEAVSESCAFDEGRMYGHSVWQGSHTLPTRAEHKVTNWIY